MGKEDPFVRLILHYSDLEPRELQRMVPRLDHRLQDHDRLVNGSTLEEVYRITSNHVVAWENGFYRPPPRLPTESSTPLDTLIEREAVLEKEFSIARTLNHMASRLPSGEFQFLLKLIDATNGGFLERFRVSPEYVETHLETIRDSLHLAMQLFPEAAVTGRVHQLDMDSALETHVLGVYREVKMGMRSKFPYGFFRSDPLRTGRVLTRFMVENLYEHGIGGANRIPASTFAQNSLAGIFSLAFGNSVPAAIDAAYPKRFKMWEFAQVPRGYWQGEQGRTRAQEATRWLVEDVLKIPLEDAIHVRFENFEDNKLGGMLQRVYNASSSRAIYDAYPGRFKMWEFVKVPDGYWKGESGKQHAQEATRWLVEKKLQLPLIDIPTLRRYNFVEHRLGRMLLHTYSNSVPRAIVDTYPDHFELQGKTRKKAVYVGSKAA